MLRTACRSVFLLFRREETKFINLIIKVYTQLNSDFLISIEKTQMMDYKPISIIVIKFV